jgi:PadR family transcriptional regulator
MKELPGGQTDLLILAVLTTGPAHGYAIIQSIKARSGDSFDLPEGTVYPALHRLEVEGFLTSAWAVVDRRRRRVYSLSAAGQAALQVRRQAWTEYSAAMNAVIGATA